MSDEAMKADDAAPDYRKAMLYHSDRADEFMGQRDDALRALAASEAKVARLVEALGVARRAIMEGGGGGVTCTVWVPDDVSPSETLVDHIDAALSSVDGAQEGGTDAT